MKYKLLILLIIFFPVSCAGASFSLKKVVVKSENHSGTVGSFLKLYRECQESKKIKPKKGEYETKSEYNLRLRKISSVKCNTFYPNTTVTYPVTITYHSDTELFSLGYISGAMGKDKLKDEYQFLIKKFIVNSKLPTSLSKSKMADLYYDKRFRVNRSYSYGTVQGSGGKIDATKFSRTFFDRGYMTSSVKNYYNYNRKREHYSGRKLLNGCSVGLKARSVIGKARQLKTIEKSLRFVFHGSLEVINSHTAAFDIEQIKLINIEDNSTLMVFE